MPSKASSQYSPASNRAEQSFQYRPKLNRIEPDLSRAEPSREWSLEPSRVGYRVSQDTNWAEPSWASSQAGPNKSRSLSVSYVEPSEAEPHTKLRAKPAQS